MLHFFEYKKGARAEKIVNTMKKCRSDASWAPKIAMCLIE